MSEILQIGLIGTGAIGASHIERISEKLTGARVVAVSDINRERAKQLSEKYSMKCYDSAEELINDREVQAVVVTSWDPTHEHYVLESIKAGKYVFCEKPLAETAESCIHIMDAEMKSGRHLVQVGFMRRFDKEYRAMKEALDSGTYGSLLMAHCVHRNATANAQYETKVNVTGTAIHEIDLMRWFSGEEIVQAKIVQPKVTRLTPEGTLDPQIIMLKTKSGVVIDVETFMHCQYGYDIQCELVAEEGTLKLPDPEMIEIRAKGKCSTTISDDWKMRFEDAYNKEFQSWINHTKKGIVAGPTAWDGYAAIAVSDACLKSRETGKPENVELIEQPSFYKK